MIKYIVLLLFIYSNCFSYLPEKEYLLTPDSLGLDFEENNIQINNSSHIATWFIKSKSQNDPIIFVLGGDGGNMSYYVGTARYYTKHVNYNIVLIDYRGFGKSSEYLYDSTIFIDEISITDLKIVYDYYKSKYNKNKYFLYGFSLGGSIAYNYITKHDGFDAVIIESPIINQKTFIERNDLTKYIANEEYNMFPDDRKLKTQKVGFMFSRSEYKLDEIENINFYKNLSVKNKFLLIVDDANHGEIANNYWYSHLGFFMMVFK